MSVSTRPIHRPAKGVPGHRRDHADEERGRWPWPSWAGGPSCCRTRASALDMPWAWTALAGGLVFLAVAEWEVRRGPPSPGG